MMGQLQPGAPQHHNHETYASISLETKKQSKAIMIHPSIESVYFAMRDGALVKCNAPWYLTIITHHKRMCPFQNITEHSKTSRLPSS